MILSPTPSPLPFDTPDRASIISAMSKDAVRQFYDQQGAREWRRLVLDPYHRLEFDTTMHFLGKYLPKRGLVLDAGCGPGRYAIELARSGYEVVLLDVSPKMLEIARRQIGRAGVGAQVKQTLVGTIDDLAALPDARFDAVLCLGGALSHLLIRRQRRKAAAELVRVAKGGGPVFVSVIGRMAVWADAINYSWSEMLVSPEVFWKWNRSGNYHGPRFAPTHFYLPDELLLDLRDQARITALVGLEGIYSTHRRRYNRVYRLAKCRRALWESHLRSCTQPVAVGISEHILAVCRK